jgi:glycosyltransferase involved in cell wall biosynthesis
MKVLLLSYHYPPSRAVGGLRAAKVAEAFRRAGHEVLVITARLEAEIGAVRLEEPGFVVRTVVPWTNPRFWYVRLKTRLARAGRTAIPGTEGAEEALPSESTSRWKRYVSALLWLPDDKQGFIPPAIAAVRRHAPRDVGIIYTTAPPFSVHLAGLILALFGRGRWIAEFRDPWTDSHFRSAAQRSRLTDAVNRWLERTCLRRADRVVSVSEGIDNGLRRKLDDGARDKLLVVRNGLERLREPRTGIPSRPLRIVHVGSFYHERDPFPFLRALASIRRSHSLGPDDVIVDLVGDCRTFRGRSVEGEVRALGLDDLVRLEDWVPHAEAQRRVDEAGLLLLLAQNQPAQIPNKLYDYLGSRVPILAFADKDGETATMLREVGGHYLVPENDPAAAESALLELLGPRRMADRPAADEKVLSDWTTARQMAHLMTAIFTDRDVKDR